MYILSSSSAAEFRISDSIGAINEFLGGLGFCFVYHVHKLGIYVCACVGTTVGR